MAENPFAFPVAWPAPNCPEPGMFLRDWFAGQALAGFCGTLAGVANPTWALMATDAYAAADAMLAERTKTQ